MFKTVGKLVDYTALERSAVAHRGDFVKPSQKNSAHQEIQVFVCLSVFFFTTKAVKCLK